jgi:NodT family efflux transporter outer membrane factor (OMF) lipoprotein
MFTACAAKRDHYDIPALDLPKQYAKAPSANDIADFNNTPSASVAPVLASPFSAALAEWWRLLGSEELNALMDRALANNPDLRIAALRIAQSKARLDQAGSDKLPALTLPLSFGTGTSAYGAKTMNQLSLKGDWRPDIWGETASMYESSELQLLRATYQRDDMQRNVAANVVVTYVEYLSLNDRMKVARATEKSLEEMLASVNARLKIGDATITEMEQQKSAVYAVRSTLPVLAQQRELILNRLASQLGAVPVELKLSHNGLSSIKFPMVLPGVPSALLLRRPDVRAMESRLLAADADIDVARARILPPLDLTAQAGYGSIYMSQLFMPGSIFWNTIANLSISIFDSGKRAKEIEFAQAAHEEMLETYVRVIYDAVREVDDALSAINFMGKRLEAQGMAADSALRAWNYSQEAFMSGAVDYLVILDTQRTYQRNLDDLHNMRLERYRGLVNLFSALGGGVPSGDAMPGSGMRPRALADEIDYGAILTDASSSSQDKTQLSNGNGSGGFMKTSQNLMFGSRLESRILIEKVDWAASSLRNKENSWLVELTGVYDRGAVLPAWRDMNARFPVQMAKQTMLPQRQGLVTINKKERASWYRLFIASFSDSKSADEFCGMLRAGQQSCSVVTAKSIKGKGEFAVLLPSSTKDNEKDSTTAQITLAPVKTSAEKSAPIPLRLAALPDGQSGIEEKTASVKMPNKEQFDGIDWSGQQFWLVEMLDAHEHRAISKAWRELITRFPALMKNHTILPRRQADMSGTGAERAFRYQLFIANFPSKALADEFCATLLSGQQRCKVVSSQTLAEKDEPDAYAPANKNSNSNQSSGERRP